MHNMDNAIDVEDLNEFVLHEILPAKQNAFQKRKLSIFPPMFLLIIQGHAPKPNRPWS